MQTTVDELTSALAHFYGSETWYKHITGSLYTDGVQYLADKAGCYWLIDEICFRQRFTRVRCEAFQVWKLRKNTYGGGAVLTCEDGNKNVVHTFRIPFTDFPLQSIELWFENRTLMLPTER